MDVVVFTEKYLVILPTHHMSQAILQKKSSFQNTMHSSKIHTTGITRSA